MSIKVGKVAGKAVDVVKRNPEIALAILGLLAPKLAAKAVKVVVAVNAAKAAGG